MYVGHYIDTKGRKLLKIGTTNDLARRAQEHTRNYRVSKQFTMPQSGAFIYDWHLPLSKYNTLRYEDLNRERLKAANIGRFIRNDRFLCEQPIEEITITIRRSYQVPIEWNK